MRFFSHHRSRHQHPCRLPPATSPSIVSAVWGCAILLGSFALGTLGGSSSLSAQPPGTPPPAKIFEDDKSDRRSLPIDAFLFRSESDNQVVMPGLTWEELQRLMDLDVGINANRETYTYQSLEISGVTDEGRAELEVVLRASVEPTDGRWISIPLKMGNFHQLAPPDVTGVDQYDTRLLPDGMGYQLVIKTDTRQDVVLRMQVTARVEFGSLSRSLEFRLPDVPSKVELTTDTKNATGEVMGRGDETAIPIVGEDGRTKFLVESSGGTFSIRWGELDDADQQLLEVESFVNIRWNSPQDQPIASIRMNIQSLKGSIDRFQLRLPTGAVMLRPPQLGTNGQTIELGTTTTDKNGIVYDVSIPDQERRPRIDLTYDLQLDSQDATSRQPLNLQIPEIVGSLRHHGELEIRTSGDFRLRWRTRPWIRTQQNGDEAARESGRGYRFRFDRATSDFPIWLGRKESQLRMVSQSTITIRDSVASLDMTIRPGGQLTEGNLQLEEASWQLHSIENAETEEPLDSFLSGFVRVIELDTDNETSPAPIRIRAEFPLDPDEDRIELPLPRVIDLGDAALVQNASVDIVSSGRTVFVIDLEATKDLRRTSSSTGEADRDRLTSHFQVLNLESPVVIIGNLVDQPPQITFSSDAKVELDDRQLRTKVDWTIASRTDLEGRLPIRIPKLATPQSSWIVTVDDVPATLRPLDDDRYELISDRLTAGSMTVRWQHALTLDGDQQNGSIGSIALPRPNISDVTIQGTMNVAFEGDQRFDLIPVESPGASDLQLDALPRDPILLRVRPRQTFRKEFRIRQSILKTVVGLQTRHEQILARVEGGDQFRVGLPESTSDLSVDGFIDGQSVTVHRDQDSLIMTLPGDQRPHVVDLRVWIPQETPSSLATVRPILKLPIESGRVFWQIVTPRDGHVVWTTPTLGRSMTWKFDSWNLHRTATHSNAQLAEMIPSAPNPLPIGNQYLYVGNDLASFEILIVSRAVIWLIVGSFVLVATALVTFVPRVRHPLTVVAVAVLFTGLLIIAPDAAVLAGQFGFISLVLIIVMVTIRELATPNRARRLFPASGSGDDLILERGSRNDRTSPKSPSSIASTQHVPSQSPTEASS